MFRTVLAKLRAIPHAGDRSDRASILLPFLIISIGLGVLAWRSYLLSARMERGADTLAMQYAGYAADISARRIDTAVQNEFFSAAEEWQQLERKGSSPTTTDDLQEWLNGHDWMRFAMYVPDGDPTSAVFSSNPDRGAAPRHLLRREFFTAGGQVHYTYDPAQLIEHFRDVLLEKPLPQANAQPQARLEIVRTPPRPGLTRSEDGFEFVAPLGAPLAQYAIRSRVQAAHGITGWENARYISVLVSFIAVALTAVGAGMALRGLKRESETMKLRGALIANVSHELRTPLSMIRLGAETLKRSAKLKPSQREEIEESILREVLHLSHLVENVLDIARIQNRKAKALAFAPVHPRELVMTVVTTYESWIRSKGFEVALRVDDPVEEQLWDREAVSRALLNLIDNAVKYSGDQKSLAVVLRQTAEDVIIEVVDNGIGIEEADLSHIFEPYYRAQFSDTQTRRGAGLGLTLVHQIVTSHGGRVEVDSKRGEGSSFRMMFPRSQSTAERPLAALEQAPQAF